MYMISSQEPARYMEFYDAMSVPMAIALSGQPLRSQPVMVKPSEAEKNLVQSTSVVSRVGGMIGPNSGGARRLYVGNLHTNIKEDDLRQVFGAFGAVELVQLPIDEANNCKGFGFVQVCSPTSAEYRLIMYESASKNWVNKKKIPHSPVFHQSIKFETFKLVQSEQKITATELKHDISEAKTVKQGLLHEGNLVSSKSSTKTRTTTALVGEIEVKTVEEAKETSGERKPGVAKGVRALRRRKCNIHQEGDKNQHRLCYKRRND
ncbi:hypothetical protein ACLB2K_041770 [Fragaria x ananassa]